MANVTDEAFRRMFAACGKPDVFWTEFVSVEALLSKGKRPRTGGSLVFPAEHPIVAQVFGAKPEQFEKAAALVHKLGFDGIDINMGCPDRDVEKQGARRGTHERSETRATRSFARRNEGRATCRSPSKPASATQKMR